MTVHLHTPKEAFAAVAWLVCSADKTGSPAELRFLYDQVSKLAIFENQDLVEFQNLFGATFSKLFQTLPTGELSIPEPDIEKLIGEIHDLLSPELRIAAYEMATALASVDLICVVEENMIERLRKGLAIKEATLQAT